MLGNPDEVQMGDTKRRILEALRAAIEPMGPKEIALATHIDENTVKQRLYELVVAGKVAKPVGRGKYKIDDKPIPGDLPF